MATRRNYTQELRDALAKGHRIACSVAPYADQPVEYAPRRNGDALPWVLANQRDASNREIRLAGRECHAIDDAVFEQALKALTDFYAWYIGDTDCKPVLIKDWESDYGSTHTVLMWEEGPDEWTLWTTHQEQPIDVLIPGWPISVGAEPYNSFTMSIYLQD